MIFELTLPDIQPSDNHIYRRSANRRMYLTQEGKDWKTYVQMHCLKQKPTREPVCIHIDITFDNKRRQDIMNRQKITLDAMQGYIYEDDSQIHELRLIKKYGQEKKMKIKVAIVENLC